MNAKSCAAGATHASMKSPSCLLEDVPLFDSTEVYFQREVPRSNFKEDEKRRICLEARGRAMLHARVGSRSIFSDRVSLWCSATGSGGNCGEALKVI